MRWLLMALAAVGISIGAGAAPSEAYYHGRWCAMVSVGNGAVREICHFNDFAACQAEVISGNRGWCGPNPYRSEPVPDTHRKRR